jgi:4-diphosphocytidyl-2-C-methyl-D-erythritol kinase
VSSADEWVVEGESTSGIDVSEGPLDQCNLVIRAAKALQAHHGLTESPAHIEIAKGIPVAGGLAGGSADAAATLVGLDRLWNLNTSDDDLLSIAGTLGSDVPFALIGGTAHGTGHGEIVEPVTDAGSYWWLLVPHPEGLSTPAVYDRYDDAPRALTREPVDAMLAALAAGDPAQVGAALWNDLQEPALELRPDLRARLDAVRLTTALGVLLSGSGPTILALARDADHARELGEQLAQDGLEPTWAAPGPVSGVHLVNYA